MSRKTILAIIAVFGAALTVFQQQLGLSIDPTAVVAGLTAIVLYGLFEAKLDLKRLTTQAGKFKDPKFWIAFISPILVAVNEGFGLNIPIEVIVTILTMILSALFGASFKKAKASPDFR